jgi:alpha-L-arabinofuranosidase
MKAMAVTCIVCLAFAGDLTAAGGGDANLGHADVNAENTLDNRKLVVPVESEMAVKGAEFSLNVPANSLMIVRLPGAAGN